MIMKYKYSLVLKCLCFDMTGCMRIYNEDCNYALDGFVEIRIFENCYKKNVILCWCCKDDPDVLETFPTKLYFKSQH